MDTETLVKRTQTTPVYDRTLASRAKTVVNVGGAGSSKSFSLRDLMIDKLIGEEDKLIVIARKTMPACKRSSYGLIIDSLKDLGIYQERNHNKTDHIYRYRHPSWKKESVMWFLGLDEPTKIKSLKDGANYIWLEEADELTYDDYFTFKLQLRRHTEDERNQIYLTFNPIDGNGWIPTKLISQDDVEVLHSTYLDNPFLNKDAVATIEQSATEDENYWRVYGLGEWGRLENLVFTNYTLIDELPLEFDAWGYGLDFGFVHLTALIKVLMLDRKLYWHECLCASGLTNSDLIERLGHFDRADIYADSAEPQRIEEIFRAGYNIYPANKDVKMGIDTCRRQTIHITKESVTLIKQIRGYMRKKDKDGNVMEEPIKLHDDTLDAGRYGTMGMTERFGFATARPGGNKPITKHSSFRF